MEVNLFGLAALVKQVLPHMREQGSGHIINVSSIAGKMVIPMGGGVVQRVQVQRRGLQRCPAYGNQVLRHPGRRCHGRFHPYRAGFPALTALCPARNFARPSGTAGSSLMTTLCSSSARPLTRTACPITLLRTPGGAAVSTRESGIYPGTLSP